MIKCEAEEQGICCTSCQEEVNLHRCEKCLQRFNDGDIIYCQGNSQFDSKHWHEDCKPEVIENGES